MHAVIRSYSGRGASELFDLLEQRTSDVENMMQSIDGFVSYLLVRTADGGSSVTVCRDKAGTDESVRKAREWVANNGPGLGLNPPVVSEGPVINHPELVAHEMAIEGPRLA